MDGSYYGHLLPVGELGDGLQVAEVVVSAGEEVEQISDGLCAQFGKALRMDIADALERGDGRIQGRLAVPTPGSLCWGWGLRWGRRIRGPFLRQSLQDILYGFAAPLKGKRLVASQRESDLLDKGLLLGVCLLLAEVDKLGQSPDYCAVLET